MMPQPPQPHHQRPVARKLETSLEEPLPGSATGAGRRQTALEPRRGLQLPPQQLPPQRAQDELLEPLAPADPSRQQPAATYTSKAAAQFAAHAAAADASHVAAADERRAASPTQPVPAATPPSARFAAEQEVAEDGEPTARRRHGGLRALPNVEYCGNVDALIAAADSWILHGGSPLEGALRGVPGAARGYGDAPRLPAPITPLPAQLPPTDLR